MKQLTLTAQHKTHNTQSVRKSLWHGNKSERLTHDHANFIDKTRTEQNVMIVDEMNDLKAWVDAQYADAVDTYNDGLRADRKIESYFDERLNKNKKMVEPFEEFVFSYGNALDVTKDGAFLNNESYGDNLDVHGEEWNTRVKALVSFGEKLPELVPEFRFGHIRVDVDESNPHIHAIGLPLNPDKTRLGLCSGRGTMLKNINERVGLVKTSDSGKQNMQNIFSKFTDTYLKDCMLEHYNSVSLEPAVRAPKRTAREKLTEKEFKRVMAPINEQSQRLSQQIDYYTQLNQQMSNYVKQLEELLDDASEDIKARAERLKELKPKDEAFENALEKVKGVNLADLIGSESNGLTL